MKDKYFSSKCILWDISLFYGSAQCTSVQRSFTYTMIHMYDGIQNETHETQVWRFVRSLTQEDLSKVFFFFFFSFCDRKSLKALGTRKPWILFFVYLFYFIMHVVHYHFVIQLQGVPFCSPQQTNARFNCWFYLQRINKGFYLPPLPVGKWTMYNIRRHITSHKQRNSNHENIRRGCSLNFH